MRFPYHATLCSRSEVINAPSVSTKFGRRLQKGLHTRVIHAYLGCRHMLCVVLAFHYNFLNDLIFVLIGRVIVTPRSEYLYRGPELVDRSEMPPQKIRLDKPTLQKTSALLTRVSTGAVALCAIYAYVYGWDESDQIAQAKRDAHADSARKG